MTEAAVLALITIVGSVITALFKLLNDSTKALKELSVSTNKRTRVEAQNSKKTVEALVKTAREAEQRNGHLGEQNVEIAKITSESLKISKEISTKLDSIKEG